MQNLKQIERDKQRQEIDHKINDISKINMIALNKFNEEDISWLEKLHKIIITNFQIKKKINSKNEDKINNEAVKGKRDVYENEEEKKEQNYMDNNGEEGREYGNWKEEEEGGEEEGRKEGREEEDEEESEGEYNDGQE